MKHIKFKFENETFWIEINNQGYAIRQVVVNKNGDAQVSCINDCLAEGIIDIKEKDADIETVSVSDFEDVWNKYTQSHRNKWNELKKTVHLGKEMQGNARYLYPQGWIVQIGDMFAICDWELNLVTQQRINGKVCGLDEINMWIKLTDVKKG